MKRPLHIKISVAALLSMLLVLCALATPVVASHPYLLDVSLQQKAPSLASKNQRLGHFGYPSGIITTVAGTGMPGYSGDGDLATKAQIHSPYAVIVGPDNDLYSVSSMGHRVRHIDKNGVITTLTGTGDPGFSGDGGPAIYAQLNHPKDIALGADGSLYIADTFNHRIRRLSSDGVITTVAGNGEAGFSGDGGPAKKARLSLPMGVTVDSDGTLYVADYRNHRIRRIGPDGIITTLTGVGERVYPLRRGPSSDTLFNHPRDLTIGPDGMLYIAEAANGRVLRIEPSGAVVIIAGSSLPQVRNHQDFIPAWQAHLHCPSSVAFGPGGALYIADACDQRIRQVDAHGVITTVAGNGKAGYSGDGGPATQAQLLYPQVVAVGPDGALYIADSANTRIRRVAPPLPGAG